MEGNLEMAMHHKDMCEQHGGTVHMAHGKCHHCHPHLNNGEMYECGGMMYEASHQEKTTMKHVKNPTAGEKAAAKDIKPGIAGYKDRVDMLKSAEKDGRLKESDKQTMSRAAKGHEKYGKEGMAALAKAGKEGKDLDKVRDKYDKYDESAPSAGLSKAKKSAVVKDAKAGKDIGKPGKGFASLAKKAGGGEKGEKIAAAAMWKNMKETTAYMAEKKAVEKKTKEGHDEMADEGNEFSGALAQAKAQHKDSFKVDGKTYPVKESTELGRLQQLTGRLNRTEQPALVENREVDQIRALTQRLLG